MGVYGSMRVPTKNIWSSHSQAMSGKLCDHTGVPSVDRVSEEAFGLNLGSIWTLSTSCSL